MNEILRWRRVSSPIRKICCLTGCLLVVIPVLAPVFLQGKGSHSVSCVSNLKADPAKTLLVYDSNRLRRNAHAPGLKGLANPPRHFNRNNVIYVNGHAKQVPVEVDP